MLCDVESKLNMLVGGSNGLQLILCAAKNLTWIEDDYCATVRDRQMIEKVTKLSSRTTSHELFFTKGHYEESVG